MHQTPYHPCLSDGSEYRPCMNKVLRPVDTLYKKRPSILDMILGMKKKKISYTFISLIRRTQSYPQTNGDVSTGHCVIYVSEMISYSLFPPLQNVPHQSNKTPTALKRPAGLLAFIPSAKVSGIQTGNKVPDLRKSNKSVLDSAATCPPKTWADALREYNMDKFGGIQEVFKTRDSSAARTPLRKKAGLASLLQWESPHIFGPTLLLQLSVSTL